jgi:ribosomal protein S18 acetylase RimI-like enzyme
MIVVRRCGPDDADRLAEIGARTFDETYAGQVPADDLARYLGSEFAVAQVRRELQRHGTIYYLADLHGRAVGYLKLNLPGAQTDLDETDALEIESLYVGMDHRRTGIGRRLMEQATAVAGQAGLHAVWLGVWEGNPNAIAFYERWGFRRFGTHTFELGRTRHNDILMKLRL